MPCLETSLLFSLEHITLPQFHIINRDIFTDLVVLLLRGPNEGHTKLLRVSTQIMLAIVAVIPSNFLEVVCNLNSALIHTPFSSLLPMLGFILLYSEKQIFKK